MKKELNRINSKKNNRKLTELSLSKNLAYRHSEFISESNLNNYKIVTDPEPEGSAELNKFRMT